eukprot:TRINITY_DN6754_c0_g2_i1.p1 TRINITY_DN6754_c0_g2~~TRINITY_DN6754_c0_g2_i1.p1  ORF type:complete len:310 (+),score=83.77 TRINITY_DN6754_c0_g2_i1:431-1360(+)
MIDELKFQNNMLADDKTYFERFVIETKKENMALKKELGALSKDNRKAMQSAGTVGETEAKMTPYETKTTFSTRAGALPKATSAKTMKVRPIEDDGLQQIGENYEGESKAAETITHLRNQMERAKKEIKQLKAEKMSLQAQRSEYEDFLVVCVEEVKKDIVKRKAMIAQQEAATRGVQPEGPREEGNVDMKNFTFQDKKKVVEMILSNEAILDELHTIIFRMGVYEHKEGRPTSMSQHRSVKMLSSAWRVGLNNQMKEWKYNIGRAKNISMKNLTSKDLASPFNQFTTHSKEVLQQIRGLSAPDDDIDLE